jgi:tetratricopeptide (TPR) repeat protein
MSNSEYLESLELKYNTQLQNDPTSNCFVLLAEVLIKQKKFDKALKVLVNGLRHNKHNTTARFLLGKLYFDRWIIDGAKKEFEKVIKLAPDNIAVSKILIQIYISEGNHERADQISRNLIFFHPDNEELKDFLNEIKSGKQVVELKEIVDDYSEFKSGVANYPNINEINQTEIVSTTLADLYYEQGHYSDSLEIYNKLLLNYPGDKRIIDRIEKIKSLDERSGGQG